MYTFDPTSRLPARVWGLRAEEEVDEIAKLCAGLGAGLIEADDRAEGRAPTPPAIAPKWDGKDPSGDSGTGTRGTGWMRGEKGYKRAWASCDLAGDQSMRPLDR